MAADVVTFDHLIERVCGYECDLLKYVQSFPSIASTLYYTTILGDPATNLLYGTAALLWAHGMLATGGNGGRGWSRSLRSVPIALHFCVIVMAADLINAWLKFPLQGDRPYWTRRDYVQVDLTCETGFGNPSGHAMVASAAWVFLSSVLIRHWIGWVWTTLFLSFVCLSRMYISAHFPHQVVLGIMIGVSICLLYVRHINRASPTLYPTPWPTTSFTQGPAYALLWVFLLFGFSIIEYGVLLLIGTDPLHSMNLAKRGCAAGERGMHSTVSPFKGIARDAGYLWGIALLYPLLKKYFKEGSSPVKAETSFFSKVPLHVVLVRLSIIIGGLFCLRQIHTLGPAVIAKCIDLIVKMNKSSEFYVSVLSFLHHVVLSSFTMGWRVVVIENGPW